MEIAAEKKYWKLGLLVAFVVLVADQVSKWFLVDVVELPLRTIEVTSFFKLVMVWNRGISFGMLAGYNAPLVLIAVSLVIMIILLRWLAKVENRLLAVAIGLVVGGALGNVVDRAQWGAVADFFYFHLGEYYWPAFNIADSGICIGVALLCWDSIFGSGKEHDEKIDRN